MALNVTSKTAIVTGSGSGINFHFAKLLLENKCNVILADLALQPEATELISAYNGEAGSARAIYVKVDVTDWKQLEQMFETAEKEFGHADIVCPGAGVLEPPYSNFWIPPGTGTSGDSPQKSHYTSLDINLTHPIRSTQLAISHFIKHKTPGSVVLISSVAAQLFYVGCPLYTAAKNGISGFVRSLATLEHPPNAEVPPIRVTAVSPGTVNTRAWDTKTIQWLDSEKDKWVTVEEVVGAMLNLVQSNDYPGGTVLEIGKNKVRKIEGLNDPGPSGDGLTVSAAGTGIDEVWTRLADPSWGQYS